MSDRVSADRLIREEPNLNWDQANARAVRNLERDGISNPTGDQLLAGQSL